VGLVFFVGMVDSVYRKGFRDYIIPGMFRLTFPDPRKQPALRRQARRPPKNAAVYLCAGHDREQSRLVQAARQGRRMSRIIHSLATSDRFRSPRPSKKNTAGRSSYGAALRPGREARPERARARRHVVDVVETNAPELGGRSPASASRRDSPAPMSPTFPPGECPPTEWVSDRVDSRRRSTPPRFGARICPRLTRAFLDPKWKGRIGLKTDQEWLAWGGAGGGGRPGEALGEKRALEFFAGSWR